MKFLAISIISSIILSCCLADLDIFNSLNSKAFRKRHERWQTKSISRSSGIVRAKRYGHWHYHGGSHEMMGPYGGMGMMGSPYGRYGGMGMGMPYGGYGPMGGMGGMGGGGILGMLPMLLGRR